MRAKSTVSPSRSSSRPRLRVRDRLCHHQVPTPSRPPPITYAGTRAGRRTGHPLTALRLRPPAPSGRCLFPTGVGALRLRPLHDPRTSSCPRASRNSSQPPITSVPISRLRASRPYVPLAQYRASHEGPTAEPSQTAYPEGREDDRRGVRSRLSGSGRLPHRDAVYFRLG